MEETSISILDRPEEKRLKIRLKFTKRIVTLLGNNCNTYFQFIELYQRAIGA